MDKLNFLNKCQNDPKFVQDIIVNFHKLYYYSSYLGGTWKNTFWIGKPVQKVPLDLWVYQEIIYKNKPDIIIETGTGSGGSTLFLANILDLIGKGHIFTVDIEKRDLEEHNRISYLIGSSTDASIVDFIYQRIKDRSVMVILDSDHSKAHVLKELEIYSEMVSINSYIIVEDTNINGFPVRGQFGEGPLEAIMEFLKINKNYQIDKGCEKFYLTFSPCGFLKRIK